MEKRYIGDAVFVEFDGYHFVLTVSNGMQVTDKISLDPSVLKELDRYIADTTAEIRRMVENAPPPKV